MRAHDRAARNGSAPPVLAGMLVAFWLFLPSPSHADTFDWTYQSPDFVGSGQLTADPVEPGFLHMTSITGTFNGIPITGIDDNVHDADNNILFPQNVVFPGTDTFLDEAIGFDWNGDQGKILFALGVGYGEDVVDPVTMTEVFGSFNQGAVFTLTPSSPSTSVLEPPGVWLTLAGLAGVFVVGRRHRRAVP